MHRLLDAYMYACLPTCVCVCVYVQCKSGDQLVAKQPNMQANQLPTKLTIQASRQASNQTSKPNDQTKRRVSWAVVSGRIVVSPNRMADMYTTATATKTMPKGPNRHALSDSKAKQFPELCCISQHRPPLRGGTISALFKWQNNCEI